MARQLHRPSTADRYWNRPTQTAPREVLDRWHLDRIRHLIGWAYEYSALYRRLYDDAGVKPADIRTWDDFHHRLPFTDNRISWPIKNVNRRASVAWLWPPKRSRCTSTRPARRVDSSTRVSLSSRCRRAPRSTAIRCGTRNQARRRHVLLLQLRHVDRVVEHLLGCPEPEPARTQGRWRNQHRTVR